MSVINKATYGYTIFFVLLLRRYTLNDHSYNNSFEFANDILRQNSGLFLMSLDMDSLSTKIPWDETRNIFIELILEENTVCHFYMKPKFKILSVTLKNQSF